MPDQVDWRTMEREASPGRAVGRLLRDQREARVHHLGQAVAALKPDVVALQEVWTEEDAHTIGAALEAAGLGHGGPKFNRRCTQINADARR